jgi:hypothetical protein
MSEDPILVALARLEVGQTAFRSEMAEVTGGIRAEVAENTRGLSAMRSELSKFRADMVEELGVTRGSIMERIDRVQDAVTAIRDDIAVNFGTADAIKRAHDSTRRY